MRYLEMKHITLGSFLAKPLFNDNGMILIRQGAAITETLLAKLKELNYVGLYVEDEISEGIEQEEVIEEGLRLQASNKLKEIITNKSDYGDLQPIISEMVDQVIRNREKLIQVNYLQNFNEHLYVHSVNVAILSIRLGLEFNLNYERLSNLAMAGLLHDIGKTMVPKEILSKTTALSNAETAELRKHPVYGYEMLKDSPRVASTSRVAVLDHHERLNGSGYPRGLKNDDISIFGKFVGIADMYDSITANRTHPDAMSVTDVIEYFMANGDVLYEFAHIKDFIQCIAVYPTGSLVQLSDGRTAIVVRNYRDCILRPYIRIVDTLKKAHSGEGKSSFEEIDLKDDTRFLALSIVKAI